jgi:hypothetical protein
MADIHPILASRSMAMPNGCIEWKGRIRPDGYGEVRMKGIYGPVLTHRASWMLHVGPIPDGLHVLHRCDNRPCINPDHLWIGTNKDNHDDKCAKCRHRCGLGTDKPNARVNPEMVRAIRAEQMTFKEIAKKYGVSYGCIQKIRCRETWNHVE